MLLNLLSPTGVDQQLVVGGEFLAPSMSLMEIHKFFVVMAEVKTLSMILSISILGVSP